MTSGGLAPAYPLPVRAVTTHFSYSYLIGQDVCIFMQVTEVVLIAATTRPSSGYLSSCLREFIGIVLATTGYSSTITEPTTGKPHY